MMRLLAIAFLVLFAGNASAENVRFPSVAVGNSAAGPEISGWVYKPSGPGPFPAIILAHTCGGVSPHTDVWGKLLVSWGYLVLAPDSFGPRGVKAVCTTPTAVTPNMRIADIAGALDYLATRPDVVKGKIGIIGHSHGGSTTIRSAQKLFGLAQRGLAAGVAYYPGCSPSSDTGIDILC
jgi:dienelactone hydrolase